MKEPLNIDKYHYEEIQLLILEYLNHIQLMQDLMTILGFYSLIFYVSISA
jgi:hypothetical protein